MKAIIVILLVLIVGSLGQALMSMTGERSPERVGAVAQALTVRISLSVGLFVLLFVAAYFGWITPH
jgi:hypothetical protein